MHPKYHLEQVLSDSGMQHPPRRQLEIFVNLLSEADQPEIGERLRKLSLGVAQQRDVDKLLHGTNAHTPEASPAASKSAARPKRGEELSPTTQADPSARHPQGAAGADHKLPPEVLSTLRQHGVHVYESLVGLKIELATLRAGEGSGAVQYTVSDRRRTGERPRLRLAQQSAVPNYETGAARCLRPTCSEWAARSCLSAITGPTDKHFKVEDQGANLFVKVRHTGRAPIALPVPSAEVFGWGELCLVALQLNRPTLGTDGHLALLRRIGRMEAPRD